MDKVLIVDCKLNKLGMLKEVIEVIVELKLIFIEEDIYDCVKCVLEMLIVYGIMVLRMYVEFDLV